jgi:phosphoglycolate phosphatase-like HAD superfamily hydrolase
MRVTDVLIDLDYTLIDFSYGHGAAIQQLARTYGVDFAAQFRLAFTTVLEAKRVQNGDWSSVRGGEAGYESLCSALRVLQGRGEWHPWSRELYALHAAKLTQRSLTTTEVATIATMYWKEVEQRSTVYPDVADFLGRLDTKGIRYHIFTGSDARLAWNGQCWMYDPAYSRRLKMERLQVVARVLAAYGLAPTSIITGDPLDKPDSIYYQRLVENVEQVTGHAFNPETSIAIGDSFIGDVQEPVRQLGLKAGYWLYRSSQHKRERLGSRQWKVGSLSQVPL